jgi:hypothetical protein
MLKVDNMAESKNKKVAKDNRKIVCKYVKF